jgi:hypothetical protein
MDDPIQAFGALLGEWTTEATHPMLAGVVVRGTASIEWLEGERFLIVRAGSDHPQFPDSISIIGDTEGLRMHYFDSRGVHRIYETGIDDRTWRCAGDFPGFSQRFTGTIEDGGRTISGLWKVSEEDETWADDLRITFRRAD